MAVSVTYAATCTVRETLATNTGSASDSSRVITHDAYNESTTLSASSTPPATTCAHFLLTLTAGAATVDLAAALGTNGATVNMTGLKVQVLRVKNLGAAARTLAPGAANPYPFLGTANDITIPPGGHVMMFLNDASADVAGAVKTIDATGTGTETSEWSIVAG
jgi:hypothetical protein